MSGATTLSIMTLGIATFSTMTLSITTLPLCWVSLCWESYLIHYYAECHYADCCCAECRYAYCHCAERHGTRCLPVNRKFWQSKIYKLSKVFYSNYGCKTAFPISVLSRLANCHKALQVIIKQLINGSLCLFVCGILLEFNILYDNELRFGY